MIKTMTTNLMVESVEETMKFYKEVLGFSEITSVPNEEGYLNFAIMANGQAMLMMQEKGNFTEEYPILKTEKVKPSISLYIMVEDLKEVYEEIKAKVHILVDVHQTFYGKDEFAIADNNGYVITITG